MSSQRPPAPPKFITRVRVRLRQPSSDAPAAPTSAAPDPAHTLSNSKPPRRRRSRLSTKPKKSAEEIAALPYDRGKYKPPPKEQFRQGNKHGKGRPRGSKNFVTIVRENLDREIKVDGVNITYRELAVLVQIKQAARGNLKALMFLISIEEKHAASNAPANSNDNSEPLSENDERALADYYRHYFPKQSDGTKGGH